MGNVIINKSTLSGEIDAISSKSLSHRYMIAASLARGTSYVSNVLDSVDLTATIDILKNLGINITNKGNDYKIVSTGLNVSNLNLNAYESGSTIRFFIPIAWLFNSYSTFIGSTTLGSRPLSVYDEIAKEFNYKLVKTNGNFPIKVKGPLRSGTYHIDGSISSQFVTGLLFSLPLVDGNSVISFKDEIASKSYIDLTVDVLKQSGIIIREENNKYLIEGNQKYQVINNVVEADYSQVAFFIVASIITNSTIKINNLNFDSLQGDKAILDIVEQMGVTLIKANKTLIIKPSGILKPITIDLYDIPDLGPILMVLASSLNDTTTFLNIDRLYIKESNRLRAMQLNLEKQGIKFDIKDNTLKLTGVSEFKGNVTFETFNDHRIAMALSVYALNAKKPVTIKDYPVVSKSYPLFYEDLVKIGGIVEYVKWVQKRNRSNRWANAKTI